VLHTVGKPLARRGARAWFQSIPTCGGKVIEFQSFSMNKKNTKITFIYILPIAMTHKHTSEVYNATKIVCFITEMEVQKFAAMYKVWQVTIEAQKQYKK